MSLTTLPEPLLPRLPSSSSGAGGTLTQVFARRRASGGAALIPYLTAGFPSRSLCLPALEALDEAGADIIELGLPFSDPLADGPVIQKASFQALQEGMTAAGTLELLAEFRSRSETPVVLFTYLNPVLRFGVQRFVDAAARAGAQGLLLTDLPVGADPDVENTLLGSQLDLIRLVAPTTPPLRVREIAARGRGFLYYISRTGVTGSRPALRAGLAREVERLREVVDLPVAVGFGISTPEQAAVVSEVADGVVVGSALIHHLSRGGLESGGRFLRSLREAMDAVPRGPRGAGWSLGLVPPS